MTTTSAKLEPITQPAAEEMARVLGEMIEPTGHSWACADLRARGSTDCTVRCRDVRVALLAAGRLEAMP